MSPRLLSLALLMVSAFAQGAEWETVLRDRTRQVELDRASVLQSDPGTMVAWGRIVMSEREVAETGYASVKALNRYDCNNRSFYTIKRVYLDAEHQVIRDERVAEPKPIQVTPGSVDEHLWRQVCKPPSARDLKKVAEEASRAATSAVKPAEVVATPAPPLRTAEFRPAAVDAPQLKPASEAASAEPRVAPEPVPQIQLPPRPSALAAKEVAGSGASAAPATVRAAQPLVRRKPRQTVAEPDSHGFVNGLALGIPAPVRAHREIHWSYEGDTGPDQWGRINPEWSTCASGQRQSPIDIRDGIRVDLEPIRFEYRPAQFRIMDNGHTVQAKLGFGNTLAVMGRRFELSQIHFHRPSEERIEGRAFDMVAHLVHQDLDGRLGVVAVLLEVGPKPNPVLQTLWNNLPLERNSEYAPQDAIDPRQLLPGSGDYYTYMGSLSEPPCSEDVLWMVMKQPVQISEDQLRIFARLYPRNARPIQRVNDRLIKESR